MNNKQKNNLAIKSALLLSILSMLSFYGLVFGLVYLFNN